MTNPLKFIMGELEILPTCSSQKNGNYPSLSSALPAKSLICKSGKITATGLYFLLSEYSVFEEMGVQK